MLHEFDGNLRVSFSAGVDAVNVAAVARCGAMPVTGCTDLLKPGGYARMTQWLANLDTAMRERGAADLAAFSTDRLTDVRRAAADALTDRRYKKAAFPHGSPKVKSGLGLWDCVVAPCIEACAVEQDVPEYAWPIAQGDYDRALEVILAKNPLPGITGYACTALCQTRCTRNDYEETVAIRKLKRIAEERGKVGYTALRTAPTGRRVAIVGGGPSGLSAAAFLAMNGIHVTIYEAKDRPGGMVLTIPPFRLPDEVIQRDIDRILALGVDLVLNTRITEPPERLLAKGFDAVYLAAGFQRDTPLRVPGVEGPGVMPALAPARSFPPWRDDRPRDIGGRRWRRRHGDGCGPDGAASDGPAGDHPLPAHPSRDAGGGRRTGGDAGRGQCPAGTRRAARDRA